MNTLHSIRPTHGRIRVDGQWFEFEQRLYDQLMSLSTRPALDRKVKQFYGTRYVSLILAKYQLAAIVANLGRADCHDMVPN